MLVKSNNSLPVMFSKFCTPNPKISTWEIFRTLFQWSRGSRKKKKKTKKKTHSQKK